MKIALIVEGKTEKAFLPSLRKFLEGRLVGVMPRLDVSPTTAASPKKANSNGLWRTFWQEETLRTM